MAHTPRTTRRTLLVDLGRTTLAASFAIPLLSACSDQEVGDVGQAPSSSTPGAGSASGAPSETGTAAAGGPVDVGATEGDLAWERASFGFVSAYVLVRDGEAAVWDTGTSDGGFDAIAEALAAAGVGPEALGHIIVSHRHGDHAGGVPAVLEAAPEAMLYAAMPDLDRVRGDATNATEVRDGDSILGIRIIATPGHTLGHISAIDEGSGLLLTGDAVVYEASVGGTTGEGVEASPPDFTDDTEAALESVRTLAGLEFETALFGHGEPLVGDAKAQFEAYAATL